MHRIRLGSAFDHVSFVIEDKNDRLQAVASHGPDGGGRQPVARALPCEKEGSPGRVGQGELRAAAPVAQPIEPHIAGAAVHLRRAVGKGEREDSLNPSCRSPERSESIRLEKVSVAGIESCRQLIGSLGLPPGFGVSLSAAAWSNRGSLRRRLWPAIQRHRPSGQGYRFDSQFERGRPRSSRFFQALVGSNRRRC